MLLITHREQSGRKERKKVVVFEVCVDEAVEDAAIEPLQEDRNLTHQRLYHEQSLEEIPLKARLVETLELASDATVV